MHFPGSAAVDPFLESVRLPPFRRVAYDPPSPELDDVEAATTAAMDELALSGSQIAVCVGSRGIHDIAAVTETVVDRLNAGGHEPVIVPAMGAHGGATAAGQAAVVADLGITPERMGCPVDSRMDTTVIGSADLEASRFDVHLASAAIEADTVLPINRIKPHTSFSDRIESGICKLTVIGLGQQPGARTVHRHAASYGFEPVIAASLELIHEHVHLPGGIGIVENFHDRTAHIEAIPAPGMVDAEATLLERAREYLATLPFDRLDLLIVDEIGKDISGTGMDTNVIGRADGLLSAPPGSPEIGRIYIRGLTADTHGNANGVGLADVIHRDVTEHIDLEASYVNVFTSGSLDNVALPLVMPTDEHAIRAAVGSLGATDPGELRIAWIQDTDSLSEFRVSPALLDGPTPPELRVTAHESLEYDSGRAVFHAVDR